MKYVLKATIPTTQYGNIIPEIELEGEDLAELHKTAEAHVREVWDKYGERPLKENDKSGKEYTTFTGEKIRYNDDTHKYYDMDGNELLSGSAYAEKHSESFNKEMLVPKIAKSWKVAEDDIDKIWQLNSEVSMGYGSAIHTALELWHKYKDVGAQIAQQKELDVNYILPKNEHLRNVVTSFVDEFGDDAEVEVLVSDVKNKMAGQIDRLQILDKKKKVCRIGDYKTNTEMNKKKVNKYQLQLSFYAHILQNHGWTVRGLDIYHYYDGWEKTELEVLDLV